LTKDTVKKRLIDDLKLFADAMHIRLGGDYFILRKQRMLTANAFRCAEDWKALAREMLRSEDTTDEEGAGVTDD
jgi:hypothetical protein